MTNPQRKIFGRRRLFATANNQTGNSTGKLLMNIVMFALIAGVFYISGIVDNDSPPPASTTPASTTQADVQSISAPPSPATDYGLRVTDNAWPKLDVSGEAQPGAASYYIILDGSGSMRDVKCSGNENKMTVATSAVKQFAQSIQSDHHIGLFVFDDKGRRELVGLAKNNNDAVVRALGEVVSGGATPLGTAIKQGVEALDRQARRQLGYGEFHLVVVTDGEANRNDDPRPAVDRLLRDTPIVLHTIGFCIDGDHSLNRDGVTLYRSANDAEGLSAALEQVLAESPDFNVSSFN